MKLLIALLVLVPFFAVAHGGEKFKVSIPVKGMHCQSCVSMVKKTIRKVEGVENVTVNLDSGKVGFEYASAQTYSTVIQAITRMGYKVVEVDSAILNKSNKSLNQ